MTSSDYYAPRAMALGLAATVGFAIWWNQGAPWAQEPVVPVEPAKPRPHAERGDLVRVVGSVEAVGASPAASAASSSDPGAVAPASSGSSEGGAPGSSPLGDAALDVGGPVGAASFAGMLASRALRREREWAVPAAAWAGAAIALAIMAPPVGLAAWGTLAVKAGAAALVAIYGHRITRKKAAGAA